jgi:hypothetical protein
MSISARNHLKGKISRDGKPLSETEGPLRIVVPHDKRQARWVRQVTSLTICQASCR